MILYIAQSLDGFIAGKNGNVSFLDQFSLEELTDHDYHSFYENIDTTCMGNNTYKQVKGFGVPFPYVGKENYVFTRNPAAGKEKHVRFVSDDVAEFVNEQKAKDGKNIWLIGGSELNSYFLEKGLIDEIWLFIAPVPLGEGIPLFRSFSKRADFRPVKSKTYPSRMVLIHFEVAYTSEK